MQYISYYDSPMGNVLLAADDIGIIGLWFEGQSHFAECLSVGHTKKELPIFAVTKRWLDIYFSGMEPEFDIPLHFIGTDFRKSVWKYLTKIPYGKTVTYGEIARHLGTSAKAVGGAVGHNPISVIVPCHRVVSVDGNLTGYAGGVEKKTALLRLEGADTAKIK